MWQTLAALVSFSLLLLFAGMAHSQELDIPAPDPDKPVHITADFVRWDRLAGTLVLEGNVVVEQEGMRVEADTVRINMDQSLVVATGNVAVALRQDEDGKEILRAEEVRINTRSEIGTMVEARLSMPWKEAEFSFEGMKITKTGENTYLVEDGRFTWCECEEGEKADWEVGADRIEADTEGDAEARGARIYIRGRPVFAVPYFRYPVGTERRSGVLIPEIETSSSDGVHFELPLYFVVNRSMDATLYPRYISGRGVDVGGEYRYNYGEPAHGEVSGFAIEDSVEGVWRGGAKVYHRTDIGDMFTGVVDATYITDNEVLFDFDHREMGDENRWALPSSLLLSMHWPYMNLSTEFLHFNDLTGGDVRTSPFGEDIDDEVVHQLPSVTYTLLTRPLIGPVMFDVSAFASNYYRQEEDLGRGQLYTVMPRVALPLRLFGVTDFWAAAGYRQWFVSPDPDYYPDSTWTGRPEAELSISSQVERIYNTEPLVMRHSVRTTVIGLYGAEPDEPEDDFFKGYVPARATELAGVNIDSRLWTRPSSGVRISDTGRLELTQLYDFEAEEYRDLRVEGRLSAPSKTRFYLDAYHSWEEWEWTRINSSIGYVMDRDREARVGYLYDTGAVRAPYFDFVSIETESVYGLIDWMIVPRHSIEYQAHYSIEYDTMVKQSVEYSYLAAQRCWGMSIRVTDRIRPSDPDEEHELSASFNMRVTDPATGR